MNKPKTEQKKKVLNVLYATIIGLLIIACAVTIAIVGANKNRTTLNVGDDEIVVSGNTYILPMQGATVVKDYSATELQFNDTLKQWEIHKGVDFIPGENSNVFAVKSGTVTKVYTDYMEGTVVEITHDDGMVSVYKSLNKELNVAVNSRVVAGAVIGKVDESMAQELATGPHLHFELLLNGAKVDPNNYLSLGNK